MEESNKNLLSSFMKKQINHKIDKNPKGQNSFFSEATNKQENDATEKVLTPEEKATAEELAEAKKLSRNKAAEQNQTQMFKKLLLENLFTYSMMIIFLIILSIAAIKLGPAVLNSLNGLISKLFLMALNK